MNDCGSGKLNNKRTRKNSSWVSEKSGGGRAWLKRTVQSAVSCRRNEIVTILVGPLNSFDFEMMRVM